MRQFKLTIFLFFVVARTFPLLAQNSKEPNEATRFIRELESFRGFISVESQKTIIDGKPISHEGPFSIEEVEVRDHDVVVISKSILTQVWSVYSPTQIRLDHVYLPATGGESNYAIGTVQDGIATFRYPEDFYNEANKRLRASSEGEQKTRRYRIDSKAKRIFLTVTSDEAEKSLHERRTDVQFKSVIPDAAKFLADLVMLKGSGWFEEVPNELASDQPRKFSVRQSSRGEWFIALDNLILGFAPASEEEVLFFDASVGDEFPVATVSVDGDTLTAYYPQDFVNPKTHEPVRDEKITKKISVTFHVPEKKIHVSLEIHHVDENVTTRAEMIGKIGE